MHKTSWAILALTMLIPSTAATALASIDYPSPTNAFYVTDQADLLSDAYEQIIIDENKILCDTTGAQICVLTVDDLQGDSIENYANETFRKWGIGAKEKNNGVLILVSKNDRKDRIEVGYGLEGDLTDAECAEFLKAGNAFLKYDDWENGIMTIYEQVAEEVYKVYDLDYADGYAAALAANSKSDSAEDSAEADGETTAEADEEYDWFDWLFTRVWFQIPIILLALIIYVIRLLGEHGFFYQAVTSRIHYRIYFAGAPDDHRRRKFSGCGDSCGGDRAYLYRHCLVQCVDRCILGRRRRLRLRRKFIRRRMEFVRWRILWRRRKFRGRRSVGFILM